MKNMALFLMDPLHQANSKIMLNTGQSTVFFIVRYILFLFNIKLSSFVCILNEFFMMCEVYAHVIKHSARVHSRGMCD